MWVIADVESHAPGLSEAQKGTWLRIANGALSRDPDESKAIALANATAKTEPAHVGLIESVIAAVQTILPRREAGAVDEHSCATRGGTWDAVKGVCVMPSKESAVVEEQVQLVERAIGADGMVRIKLIKPGWGSSGYYGEDVLKRDGPRIWPKGTKMYADHPTIAEERDRPERSIKDIAAVFAQDPVWENDTKHGAGLYTRAKVVDTWKPSIEALIGTIDTSIRASGKGSEGEREGRRGTIVEQLTKGLSVDFVTNGGAGGKLISLAESARSRHVEEDMDEKDLIEARRQLSEAQAQITTLTTRATTAETNAARLQEAVLIGQATGIAQTKLKEVAIPDSTKARIVATVSANPPIKDGKLDETALTAALVEAAKVEAKYLKDLGVGDISGINGDGGNEGDGKTVAALEAELAGVFSSSSFGFSEAEAKIAAQGRGN